MSVAAFSLRKREMTNIAAGIDERRDMKERGVWFLFVTGKEWTEEGEKGNKEEKEMKGKME